MGEVIFFIIYKFNSKFMTNILLFDHINDHLHKKEYLLKSLSNGGKIKDHYLQFPKTPAGFKLWCEEAEMIWEKIGTIADSIPESERM